MTDISKPAPADEYAIQVEARSRYVPDESAPESDRYVFAYTIVIRNVGRATAQLVSRHWVITDAANRVQEVRGMGVVGAQPTLAPGETFEYTSGASIATPVGTMRGAYLMVGADGRHFDAEIPEFALVMPRTLH